MSKVEMKEEMATWQIPETNFTIYFLLKILNRHCLDWTFGEDIRILVKVPEIQNIGEGKGFSSKIYSVKIFLDDDREFCFCVKIPSIFHLEASIEAANEDSTEEELDRQLKNAKRLVSQSHLREVNFYKFISAKVKTGFLQVPKYVYGREWDKDQEGILIIEDFTSKCDPEMVPRKPFSHDQVLALIEQIARLQISTFADQESCYKQFAVLESTLQSMSKYASLSCEVLLSRNLDFFTEEVADKIMDLVSPTSLFRLLTDCPPELKPVLVHSNIWPGNVLWSNANASDLLALIDFQGVFLGSPTADLAALLAVSTSGEQRNQKEDVYLQFFVDKFNQLRSEADNSEEIPLYEFDIIREAYGKSMLYSMIELTVVVVTNPLDDVPENGQETGPMSERLKCILSDLL